MRISDNMASPLAQVASAYKEAKTYQDAPNPKQIKIMDAVMPWIVFFLCLLFSGIGVMLSFLVFGQKILEVGLWGVGFTISIVMLGISYGAKYANPDARKSFTPVDLIQYLTQGFLWPSTWPALADFLGVQKISPANTSWLFDYYDQVVAAAHLFSASLHYV